MASLWLASIIQQNRNTLELEIKLENFAGLLENKPYNITS